MKKTLLGLFAAFALFSFSAPAFAGDEAAGAPPAEGDAKGKKAKKSKKKAEGEAPAGEAAPAK